MEHFDSSLARIAAATPSGAHIAKISLLKAPKLLFPVFGALFGLGGPAGEPPLRPVGRLQSAAAGRPQDDAPFAFVRMWTGDARVRPGDSTTWYEIHSRQPVYLGDRLFTGADGSIVLEYATRDHTSVRMGPRSILEVTENIGLSSRLLKGVDPGGGKIGAVKGEKQAAQESELKTSALNDDDDDGNTDNAKQSSGESSESDDHGPKTVAAGFEVHFEVKEEKLVFPSGDLYFVKDRFPARIPVIGAPTREKLYGSLWRTQNGHRAGQPVWSGVARAGHPVFDVFAGSPGTYLFQATSGDGRLQTRRLKIDVALPAKEPDAGDAASGGDDADDSDETNNETGKETLEAASGSQSAGAPAGERSRILPRASKFGDTVVYQ